MPNFRGLDYALPANRYIQEQGQVAPEQDATLALDLPKTGEDLMYVEGLTDKYINTRGKIEAYALDMKKRFGIDVTRPDYSQLGQGGGIPFKTYQKLATELMVTANDLKQSAEMQKQEAPYRMSGQIQDVQGFDPSAQPINRVNPNERYFSTKLLPEVEAANKILDESVYSADDFARFKEQVLDPTIANLTSKMEAATSPAEKQRLQFNIDALKQKPQQLPPAYFQGQYNPRDNGNGADKPIEYDILKDTTNLAQGKWGKGTYKIETNEEGDPVLVNRKREGEQYGEHTFTDEKTGQQKRVPRIIDRWEKRADGIYLVFKTDESVAIPPEKVSDKRGDAIASSLIGSNAKYGDVRKMYEAARKLELTDSTGSVVNEKLLSSTKTDETPDPTEYAGGITAEKNRIKSELKKINDDPGIVNRNFLTITLPDGEAYNIYKNRLGGGFYVDGQDGMDENLKDSDVIKLLAKEKYFDKFLSKETASSGKQTPPQKRKGFTGEELKRLNSDPNSFEQSTQRFAAPVEEQPKFKSKGESGLENLHPWALQVGNRLVDILGVDTVFNSIHRTKERNKEVGGKEDSYHLVGAGIDLSMKDWNKVPAEQKKKLMSDFGVDVVIESDHVHLEPKSKDILAKYEGKTQAARDLDLIRQRRNK